MEWLPFLLLPVGFVALIKGADWLVDGAGSVARRLGVSDLVIGLTIVALGTSMPELLVNILAAVQGNTDLAVGNVVGSNIANILLILGVSAIIYPVHVERNTVWKEIPFALLAAVLLLVMPNDILLDGEARNVLSRTDGLVLLLFLCVFLYYVYEAARGQTEKTVPEEVDLSPRSGWASAGLIVGGLAGLTLGGKWVVDGAVALSETLGMSQEFIGLTVVAVGTSLPELATGIAAARRRNSAIVVGNAVGSNIFNIFLVIGLTGAIIPVPLDERSNTDILFMIGCTLLLFGTMFFGAPKYALGRREGFMFVGLYVAYLAFATWRG